MERHTKKKNRKRKTSHIKQLGKGANRNNAITLDKQVSEKPTERKGQGA